MACFNVMPAQPCERRVDDREPLLALLEGDAGDAEHACAACRPALSSGPATARVPGAGCGNAVERAVWKVTLPSTFCITWWMWPLSTVTEPKRFR